MRVVVGISGLGATSSWHGARAAAYLINRRESSQKEIGIRKSELTKRGGIPQSSQEREVGAADQSVAFNPSTRGSKPPSQPVWGGGGGNRGGPPQHCFLILYRALIVGLRRKTDKRREPHKTEKHAGDKFQTSGPVERKNETGINGQGRLEPEDDCKKQ